MKKLLTLVLVLIGAVNAYSQNNKTIKEFNPNFAHTVYFWLEKPNSKDDKAAFLASLKRFMKNSKYAKTNFIGVPPKASREVVDGSFTFSLIVTFKSAEEQKKYQDEEAHLKFVEESSKLWTKVIVYDSITVK